MNKTLWVAWREFCATALTKGFIIAVVMTPLLMLVVVGAMAALKDAGSPKIVGKIAVIDQSGLLADRLNYRFSPDGVAAEAKSEAEKTQEEVKKKSKQMGISDEHADMASGVVGAAAEQAAALGPRLDVEVLGKDADVEKEKEPVASARIETTKSRAPDAPLERLALVVVTPQTVTGDESGVYPPFRVFFAEKLDFEIQEKVQRRVAEAVVDVRLASDARVKSSGMSPDQIRSLIARPRSEAKTVSKQGEQKSIGELAFILPMAFMILMMVSVFTSGQYLLTTTVEEKSNRVMEVLLSAVSPLQLMTGKIIGQMAVGLVILVIYSGLGMGSLVALARADLIDPMQLVYLACYFVIAYFIVASMMAAIGASVNEMREAQTLMSPVMVVLMIPWLTWFLIQRAPNSTLATVLSFIPGPSPFVMVIRLSGSEPVPAWQIPATMGVGVLSVLGMLWAAAKVFRIGVLMYGKPPNLKTLFKWVRMA